MGEISLPEATIVPSPDLWVGPDLWEGEDSDIWIVKYHVLSKNKFFRTKMRPKEGTKTELQRDLSDFLRFVRFSGLDLSDLPISLILKINVRRTDGGTYRPTDGPIDGLIDPLIEMRGRI